MWNKYDSCNIQYQGTIGHDILAFALEKASYWNEPISGLMLMYHESGQLAAIERKWFDSKCQAAPLDLPDSFGLVYLSGACSMIVMGFLLSVCVFILEHIYFAINKRRKSYNPPRDIKHSSNTILVD